MRMPFLLAISLLAAGCLGPEEPVEAASLDAPTLDAAPALPVLDRNATVDVPEWRVGDAWEVESKEGDETARLHLVVTKADGSSYQVRSTSERMATYDAMFDVSYVGRIRASDLAGHQQDQPVQFFSFPLADGKAWSTQWDGTTIALRAGFAAAIPTPLGPQPGFVIQGTTEDGETYVEYDYVPALRWWSRIMFAEGYGFTVVGASSGWAGEYAEASARTLLTLGPAAPVAGTPGGAFTVDADQSAVVVLWVTSSPAHVRALAIVDPEHQEQAGPSFSFAAGPSSSWEMQMLPPKAGQWHLLAPHLHPPGGFGLLTVQQVAIAKVALAPI